LPIDAPNLSALLGKFVLTEKKAREIITGNNRRYNIVAHCLMAQGALLRQYISAGSDVPSLVLRLLQKKKRCKCSPRFAYSSGHCLFILLYWGGNGNT
jgi:hypothetical protein